MKQRGDVLTIALIGLVGLLISGAGGFFYGKHVEAAEQAQEREKAVLDAIQKHNEAAAVAMNMEYQAGLRHGRLAAKGNQNRQEFSHAISERPSECRRTDKQYGLLLTAVELANNETTASIVPDPVLTPSKTLKPVR